MRIPNIAIAYKYSLTLLMKSWCQLVEVNAESQGFSQNDVEDVLFEEKDKRLDEKMHFGRQWRRWRDSGQLTDPESFKNAANKAVIKGWIDKKLNSLFCEAYERRFTIPPTDDNATDEDIREICEYFAEYSERSQKLKKAYEDLRWYSYGPDQDDPSLKEWEKIHIRLGEFISLGFIYDEIENKLLELQELTSGNKTFHDLTPNIENVLKKLRKNGRIK